MYLTPPTSVAAAVVLAAALLAGCGGEGDYTHYADAARSPAPHELGPHGGHLIELDHGAAYAELVFDEAARTAVLHVLDRDFLHRRAVDPATVRLDLVERRPYRPTVVSDPLPHDPAGSSSRFRAAGSAFPASVRTIEDVEGMVTVSLDGKEASGSLGHDHGGNSLGVDRSPAGHAAGAPPRLGPLLAVYCLLIVTASLGGGWLPLVVALTHTRMQTLISLVGGLMLGIGLFHMLPHAIAETGSVDSGVRWAMAGLLGMFFLIRTFHFHQHSAAEVPAATHDHDHDHAHDHPHDHDHDHGNDHDHASDREASLAVSPVAPQSAHPRHAHHHPHGHPHGHSHGADFAHPLSWLGVAVGLGLHTAIDGMALAASMRADASHGQAGALFGLGTFLAIVLHKPLDAVSISTLMQASGWSAGWRHAVNAGFALMCPLGAALFLLGVDRFSGQQSWIVGSALAFSAGVFLCISLGDLLPELEFHSHDRLRLSAALLLGVVLAWAIGFLEPAHTHGGGHGGPATHSH